MVLVFVHLQPGARRTAVCGEHGGRLKIAVTAAPHEGRANEALVAFLASTMGLPRRSLRLVAGAQSRDKTVSVDGIDVAEALRLLAQE